MRYFTAALWLSDSPASERQWSAAVKRYWKQLEKLLPALDPPAQRFFQKVSLHDGWLLGTGLGTGQSGRNLTFAMEVGTAEGDRVYQLHYDELVRFELNRVGEAALYDAREQAFGTWGYDELTQPRKGIYRHEVLFSSGTTLLVEFQKLRVTSKKVKR